MPSDTNSPSISANPTSDPTASPTYPCFASEAGGYRSVEKGKCQPEGQTCALFDAVHDYYLQDCDSDSACEIGQVWGHPIGTWCVGSVVNMERLFEAGPFGYSVGLPNNITPDLSGWDTSSAESMRNMFVGQTLFNGNLSQWDTSSVTNMYAMFDRATSFNSGSLSNWNTSSVTSMGYMFRGATSFDQDLFWDTFSVTYMQQMFFNAESFNSSSISNWDVSSVTSMFRMFYGATDFAQNLCPWKDAPAVSLSNCLGKPCTYQMFTNSLGQPNELYNNPGDSRFNAAC